MAFLFSSEFFGFVLTLVGSMIYGWTPTFSIFRTIIAILFTIGGVMITLQTKKKPLLIGHGIIWATALLFPVMPSFLQTIFSTIYALALIPFVLYFIKWLYNKILGGEEASEEEASETEGYAQLPTIIYDANDIPYQKLHENDAWTVYQNSQTGQQVTIPNAPGTVSGSSVTSSAGTFHWY